MILQPPFPNQEVRWELKTKPAFAPATPLQSGCPWQRPVGLCQCWATSVPGLLWVQKNVKEGGGDLETFLQLRMNGCPPNTLPHSLSYPLFPHTEEKQKSATNPSLCIHFFSLSRESLHPLVRVLSLTSSNHFILSDILGLAFWALFVGLITNSTSYTEIWKQRKINERSHMEQKCKNKDDQTNIS